MVNTSLLSDKREAKVLNRIAELKEAGLWSAQRLPKLAEPSRHKMHWDYLCEEMAWLANDFRMEKKWKIALARKTARLVVKWHEAKAHKEAKELRIELARKKRVAGNIAKEATKFWKQMLQVVDYKQKLELEAVKREALERHLDFIVGQTERFTSDLKTSMAAPALPGTGGRAPAGPTAPVAADEGASADTGSAGDSAAGAADAAAVPAGDTPALATGATAATADAADAAKAEDSGAATATDASAMDTAGEDGDNKDDPKDAEFNPSDVKGAAAEDDESTLSQQDEPTDAKGELNELAGDADIDIKELLKMYPGYAKELGVDADDEEESGNEAPAGDEEGDDDDDGDADEPPKKRETRGSRKRRREDVTPDKSESAPAPRSSRRSSKRAAKPKEITPEPEPRDEAEGDVGAADTDEDGMPPKSPTPPKEFEEKAAKAEKFQPTGVTVEDNGSVKTAQPFLLKAKLRPYQHIGLDWLANMYGRKLNGILADEMGLGKTIQTISLLAHLAVERGNWGPHLIIVPTSVMLNWEHEFKKFCPAFKLLIYYGSIQQRKEKRTGWTKPDAFHVCITSYHMAVQDNQAFRRKKWKYLILDEAHLIKNFESKRWQTLLGFSSKRRLLLTGTPLQNNLMELWSLMHFLMPHIFQSHAQFKEWFGNPANDLVDSAKETSKEKQIRDQERVHRLHTLLRPFLLRRLKADVEKQMPSKTEHVIKCGLSKRQRFLYDDFMSKSDTKANLGSGNYMHIINVLMQLRKVCNHPNLFAEPDVQAPLVLSDYPMRLTVPAIVYEDFNDAPATGIRDFSRSSAGGVDVRFLGLCLLHNEMHGNDALAPKQTSGLAKMITELPAPVGGAFLQLAFHTGAKGGDPQLNRSVAAHSLTQQQACLAATAAINGYRTSAVVLYGPKLRALVSVYSPAACVAPSAGAMRTSLNSMVLSYQARKEATAETVQKYHMTVAKVEAFPQELVLFGSGCRISERTRQRQYRFESALAARPDARDMHSTESKLTATAMETPRFIFPDLRLIQYDCGKLQALEKLLRRIKPGGHRVLIFTQMTKMLDILEQFLTYHAMTYLRLDGSTGVENRQRLMDRFNSDIRIFAFILSTRSGGIGINLTGADTVVFYDSDWNPTMDAQAQDRCHRIGQTRDVHIYRLVSEQTVEENILKKANQKRALGQLAIESGEFTTDFFSGDNLTALFDTDAGENPCSPAKTPGKGKGKGKGRAKEASVSDGEDAVAATPSKQDVLKALNAAEDADDQQAASVARQEQARDDAEFDESKPLGEDNSKAISSTSENDSGLEDEAQLDLKAQLERLRGVELHALQVLERYLTPMHQKKLELARQAIVAKDEQFKEIEAKIRASEKTASDDEDELFYDKDEAYKAYIDEATAGADVYAPPNPNAPDEVYIEPAHAMQYRVGYMVFKQTIPKPIDGRKRRRRKRRNDPHSRLLLKRRDSNSENFNYPHNSMNAEAHRKRMRLNNGKRPDGTLRLPSTPVRPASQSLFRKLDEFRGIRNPLKIAKHPKLPSRKNAGRDSQRRAETDTNRDAPLWSVEEDWQLLQAVRMFLNHNGSLNWSLVSDAVNSATSLTGRTRSKTQCRDRYFRVVMPREEGRADLVVEKPDPKKKNKKLSKVPPGAVAAKANKKQVPTQRLYELDNKKSVGNFHETCFNAVQTAIKLRKASKPKSFTANNSFEAVVRTLVPPGQPGQTATPVLISEARMKRMKEQRDKDLKEHQAKQEQRVVARMHGAQQPGGSAKVNKARVGTPGSQPQGYNTSHRLTLHVIHKYNNEEAKAAAKNIYGNPTMNERQKVEQLTVIIKRLQAADPRQRKGSLSNSGSAKGTPPTTPRRMSASSVRPPAQQGYAAQPVAGVQGYASTAGVGASAAQRVQPNLAGVPGGMHTLTGAMLQNAASAAMNLTPGMLQNQMYTATTARSPVAANPRAAGAMAATARSPAGLARAPNMASPRPAASAMAGVRASPLPQQGQRAAMASPQPATTTYNPAVSALGQTQPLLGQSTYKPLLATSTAPIVATSQAYITPLTSTGARPLTTTAGSAATSAYAPLVSTASSVPLLNTQGTLPLTGAGAGAPRTGLAGGVQPVATTGATSGALAGASVVPGVAGAAAVGAVPRTMPHYVSRRTAVRRPFGGDPCCPPVFTSLCSGLVSFSRRWACGRPRLVRGHLFPHPDSSFCRSAPRLLPHRCRKPSPAHGSLRSRRAAW